MCPEYNRHYHQGGSQLYVSRSAEYIGLAGRVGQRSESTLSELRKQAPGLSCQANRQLPLFLP